MHLAVGNDEADLAANKLLALDCLFLMRHTHTALVVALLSTSHILAQTPLSVGSPEIEFEHALMLYDASLYGAARSAFASFTEQYSDCDLRNDASTFLLEDAKYFEAASAKALQNADGGRLLDDFQHYNQHNSHRADALYHLGDFYLNKGNEDEALVQFEKCDENEVSSDLRTHLLFKRGYCHFMQGKHDLALAQFDKIRGDEGEYASAILYYRAHVAYENGNLDKALKSFLQLEKDNGFHTAACYYIADIMYQQGHYTEAMRYAKPLTEQSGKQAEMLRIMADSHFMLGEYDNALQYYAKLKKAPKGKLIRADHYHIGLCYYNKDKFKEASESLSQVTSGDDAMAQSAYYHLASCCLKTGDKKKARTAFDAASRYNFDKAVAEDAHFNKLKLAYELNFSPFDDIITAFAEFLNQYPETSHRDEAYSIMGKALISTKNYKQALETLEKVQHKDLALYKSLQRIAFYHGLELYNDQKRDEAKEFLAHSLRYADYDPLLKARAYYWTAECIYADQKYDDAREQYLMFINSYRSADLAEFASAHYNVGYTYYNRKDYNNARRWFLRFTSLSGNKNKFMMADANNRIGDCMYVERNFESAISYYDKALSISNQQGDYSLLQKGICLGLQNDYDRKIVVLDSLVNRYPKSVYADNAYFEKARAYVAIGDIPQAIYNYKVVKEKYPKGSLASQSMLQLGLLYYNNNEYDNSKAFYKRVINEYPSTPEAADALNGLRNVYMEQGDYDGYIAYTSTLGSFAHVGLSERDSLLFVSASNQYMKGNLTEAKAGLQRYLETFADGRYVTPANFYLADCYYTEKEFDKALTLYEKVAEQPRSIFTEEALLRGGELEFHNADYGKALATFGRLENEAEVETNRIEAIIGQMRCMSKLGDVQKCIEGADKVIEMPQASPAILREAKYLKAKSLITLSRSNEALTLLRELSADTKSAEGAEAKYLLAQLVFDGGDVDGAEKEVFDYIENGTPHQYWLARSFVLLSDIYHAKNDDFQAIQYLETLRESYVPSAEDNISTMIENRLAKWQTATDAPAQETNTQQ